MNTSVLLVALSLLGASLAYTSTGQSKIKTKDFYMTDRLPAAVIKQNGSRIIGGHESEPNSHPYMVALLVDNSWFCGASLISPSWVLTAAHCAELGRSASVILGAHKPLEVESTQVTVNSMNIIIHPEWSPETLRNDIALIQLPAEIPLSPAIQPISIAQPDSGSFAGATALLTGWGLTSDEVEELSNVLMEVEVDIISNEECGEILGGWAFPDNLCTAADRDGQNAGSCYGDSGSPLVVDDVQVGIVSFGNMEECEGGITSYARLSSYADWIESVIRQEPEP